MAYKRELIAKTKNLFNLATASVGYIDWEGKLNHSEDTITYGLSSDYLECTPNTSYTISAFCGKHPVTNDSTLWCRIAYYDENKQLLTAPSEWFTDTNIDYISATWTAPTNAKYLRATTRWMSPTYREQHPENWVMLEKGSTATDYVPYGRLTSYKKLLKVSDVCQLLDKRTFGTRTDGGITATYNNDGTFTVSGTATANSWKNFPVFQLLPGGGEHVYLFNVVGISGDINCYCNIYFYDEITDRAVELMQTGKVGFAVIKKLETPTVYQARFNITTLTGATPNNIVYKPQLFDLTEMYGAGNEPKTVDEFRAKFPNELYPYSPRCWVTSYKTGLIAKTKNLLTEIKPFSNTKVENGIVYQGIADTRELDTLKVQLYNGDTFVKQWSGIAQQIGKNTLTFTTNILPAHTRIIFGLNGLMHDMTVYTPITLENNTTYTLSMDFINITQGEIAWTNSMLEKGSTATDYVPYGYL